MIENEQKTAHKEKEIAMAAFKPVQKTSAKSRMYQIRMTEEMFDELEEASLKRKIPKQELIRQMVQYGLEEMRKKS